MLLCYNSSPSQIATFSLKFSIQGLRKFLTSSDSAFVRIRIDTTPLLQDFRRIVEVQTMFPNSPFNKHLQTNYVPSCIDVSHVQQVLLEPQAELSKLNDHLSHLKRQLDGMKKERDELKDGIDEHHHLLAPFRRLPDDMLREIFLWCLPDDHEAIMSIKEPPLILGRVCQRWNFVVYRTPRLWASLHVALPFAPSLRHASPSETPLEILEKATLEFEARVQLHQHAISEWLCRSGSCPLSISIHPNIGRRHSRPSAKVQSYLNLVFAFAHRLCSLDITVPRDDLSRLLASISFSTFPIPRPMPEFLTSHHSQSPMDE
ncbi:hypothetical protein BDZ97DRAFT_591446 [Flammula alnicola]|nr:hypothetical protein BDZ97DRAFT_591446 [Flammula alnicola]